MRSAITGTGLWVPEESISNQELVDSHRESVEAWNAALDNVKLKAMSADKPQYVTLSAASSPTSPIRQLFEAVAHETMLTHETEGEAQAADGDADVDAAVDAATTKVVGKASSNSCR